MRSIGQLLDRRLATAFGVGGGYANIRVLHAYRDPRAVASSRHAQGDPLLGKHAAFVVDSDPVESTIREARMYCRTAADDFRFRFDVVDRRHPGVVASLDFDLAVDDVEQTVGDVYRFVTGDATVPPSVADWTNRTDRKSARRTSWRSRMAVDMSDRILALDECIELCRYINCR